MTRSEAMILSSTLPAPRPRILLVDGDGDLRSTYSKVFEGAGFDVVQAADGREALTKALIHPPHLILTELRLSLIDAYSLCRIIRTDRATAHVPIVVVTADTGPTELERIRGFGANEVFLKPVTPDVLLTSVQQLVAETAHTGSARPTRPRVDRVPVGLPARREEARRTSLAKAHRRSVTTEPPLPPPSLKCPRCDLALTYEVSHVGGVSERHPEQWDYLTCSNCGGFQYRQRTRKIRSLNITEERWLKQLRRFSD